MPGAPGATTIPGVPGASGVGGAGAFDEVCIKIFTSTRVSRLQSEMVKKPTSCYHLHGGKMLLEHRDVVIVGAGLSGIGAGYYLQTLCPGKTYALLEGRDAIGGTWDLFRYPGVRSDSDMYTLGYQFRPWT